MEHYQETGQETILSSILRVILIVVFAVLLGRLIELQVIEGGYYRSLSEGNRIRRVPISAPRGRILARGGEILVGNSDVKKKIIFNPDSGYKKIDAEKDDLSGELLTETVRDYPLGASFAHVSGYLGKVGENELGKVNPKCINKGILSADSIVGRGGLEEYYDCILRGSDGEELIEVDSMGRKIRVLGKKDPIPGTDITTSIDFNLQKFVGDQLKGQKGVIIVTDTKSEILALFSSPSYDPNVFINPLNNDQINSILNDGNLPLFNRAIAGTYHPGSTFKPIVAISALEDKVIDANYIFNDEGRIVLQTPYGVFTYNNWYFTQYGRVEGKINLVKAITRSTDTFFYKLGEMEGVDGLVKWSKKFGLADLTGIDLPGEVKSLVPSPQWKEEVKGEKWFLGNTYHMSIGQGDIALTPIALNQAIAAVANGGLSCHPSIIMSEGSVKDVSKTTNGGCSQIGIEKENIDLVKAGMKGVCSVGGTGFPFFDFKEKNPKHIDVACKTGTAETGINNKTHALFIAFGPVDKPEIITTVLVEEGGEGSTVAGPIARKIFDYYFK
jgi:penicillin-binding protein 2